MTMQKVLGGIVGQDQVSTEPHALERYASDGSFSRPMRLQAVVMPHSADEVQRLVRVARDTGSAIASAGDRNMGDVETVS